MLPRWTDSERLVLGQHSLALHRRNKTHAVNLTLTDSNHIDFDKLAVSLPAQLRKLGGHRINLVLSNYWIRYLILPWRDHVYARKDWLALARNSMQAQFGVNAAEWDVDVHLQGYGKPVVSVATDQALVTGLDRLADQLGWQIQRIEPAFSALVNRHPKQWRGDSWLMMADDNRLLLVESKAGIWHRSSSMLSSPEMLNHHAMMLLNQARQFNPETKKRRLYLCRTGVLPEQNLVEGLETKLLPADWLSNEVEAVSQ